MQPIIDIIYEKCENYIDDYLAAHSPSGFFVDRGDPNQPDFQAGAFTQDCDWHELDLSAIIPEATSLVLFRLVLVAPGIARYFFLRKAGNHFTSNAVRAGVQIGDHRNSIDVHCSVDSSRKIEYMEIGGVFATINLTVAGWWL